VHRNKTWRSTQTQLQQIAEEYTDSTARHANHGVSFGTQSGGAHGVSLQQRAEEHTKSQLQGSPVHGVSFETNLEEHTESQLPQIAEEHTKARLQGAPTSGEVSKQTTTSGGAQEVSTTTDCRGAHEVSTTRHSNLAAAAARSTDFPPRSTRGLNYKAHISPCVCSEMRNPIWLRRRLAAQINIQQAGILPPVGNTPPAFISAFEMSIWGSASAPAHRLITSQGWVGGRTSLSLESAMQ